jgi:hypothetical protein
MAFRLIRGKTRVSLEKIHNVPESTRYQRVENSNTCWPLLH